MFNILCPSARLLFYSIWYNFYFMHLGAIIILCASTRLLFYARQRNFMQGNFRHWQASTPIGVVLKWRGRLRACSQRLPRRFNTIAPLGAEDCQWLFSLSCLHLGGSKSAKVQNCQWLFSIVSYLKCVWDKQFNFRKLLTLLHLWFKTFT